MVKVIVLGHGLIPRGKGIAPCKAPFEADKKMIKLMLGQGGLIVKIYNPNTDAYERVTFKDFERKYDAYEKAAKTVTAPVKDLKGNQVSKEDITTVKVGDEKEVKAAMESFKVQDVKEPVKEEKKNDVVEASKEAETDDKNKNKYDKNKKGNNTFKPVNAPDSKG